MSALGLVLTLAVAAGGDGGVDVPMKSAVPDVMGALTTLKKGHAGETQCASCHVTASWTEVRFNHDRTGFPLTGKHAKTTCKACHVAEFSSPIPRGCVGCHRDVHAGELGARCENCHDTGDWRSRFDADAHRRTNFPLFGAHAALPCQECHMEARERRFSRSTVACADCHRDAALTRTSMAVVNHALPQNIDFQDNCASCHNPIRWKPANFYDHESCFPILSGPHAALECTQCHSGTVLKGAGLACQTRNAVGCTQCHTNAGSGVVGQTDSLHMGVQLYSYAGAKCASCHKGTGVAR